MVSKRFKIILLSHFDLDGFGCNIVVKNRFAGHDITTRNVGYNNINKIVKELILSGEIYNYDALFITDISVDEEVAELIDNLNRDKIDIALFDHHESTAHLLKYDWATIDKEHCGAYITNEMLSLNDDLDDLINLINDYDTWAWEAKGNVQAKRLNDLMKLIGVDKFVSIFTENANIPNVFNVLEKYKELLDINQRQIDEYISKKNKSMQKKTFKDKKVGIVFADMYLSELGNELCKMNEDVDYVMMINMATVSLRTVKNDIDLSKIAEQFGGGGHKKASGFICPGDKVQNFINNLLDI